MDNYCSKFVISASHISIKIKIKTQELEHKAISLLNKNLIIDQIFGVLASLSIILYLKDNFIKKANMIYNIDPIMNN